MFTSPPALALAAFNPASRIAIRVLDRDLNLTIDRGWFVARVRKALALRERLYDAPFYRLIHAEGDGLPGVVVDRFGDTLVVLEKLVDLSTVHLHGKKNIDLFFLLNICNFTGDFF